MLTEAKLLFDNIRKFRKGILNEAVADDRIINAINGNEYVYIYYSGDDTIQKGFRIVRPFVLGSLKNGNKALRAWEEKGGNSDSFYGLHGRRRIDHEYFTDYHGTEPGWRLFLTDKITQMLPTGKTFDLSEDGIPPKYNPNDKQMSNIIAAIPIAQQNKVNITGLDSLDEPDKYSQAVNKKIGGTFKGQDKSKFYDFSAGNTQKQIVRGDVEKIYDLINKIKKKNPRNYLVATDNKGNFIPVLVKYRNEIPKESYVGDLYDLYSRLVLPVMPTPTTFFKDTQDKRKQQLDNKKKSF